MKLLALVTLAVLTCGVLSSFRKDILVEHNLLRKKHGVKKLRWDIGLATLAQRHCNGLADADKFESSRSTGYGENLYKSFAGMAPKDAGKRAADAWYADIKYYDFSKPGYTFNTAQFTQVYIVFFFQIQVEFIIFLSGMIRSDAKDV